MTYDVANELLSISYSDSSSENVTINAYSPSGGGGYDADGQLLATSDATGSTTWAYDSLHRMTSYRNGKGVTTSYGYTYGVGPTYDLRNQVRSLVYPNSAGTVTQTWDADGRLSSVADWNSKTTSFGYDANSNYTTETVPSTTTVTDTFGFNPADQMTSVSDSNGSSLFSAAYTRDSNGQLASDSSQAANQSKDKYSALNQICYAGSASTNACSSPPTSSYPYAYSSADNLTTMENSAHSGSNTQQFNNADELCWTVSGSSSNACGTTPSGAATYHYDTNGNRTSVVPSSGSAICDVYDQPNRITTIKKGTGTSCTTPTTIGTYTYDSEGIRQSKTVGSTTTQYSWSESGASPLLIQQKAGSTVTNFINGPGGLPVEQIQSSTKYWLHHDQIGSTRLITNSSGSSAATFSYDPYGNVVSCTKATVTINGSNLCTGTSIGNILFMFTGQIRDDESNLYYNRARYYDPSTAQFLSRDPAVATTMSPYAYVVGNPLNMSDPSGLEGCVLSPAMALIADAEGNGTPIDPNQWVQPFRDAWNNSTTAVKNPMPGALGRSSVRPDRLVATLGDCPWLVACCAGWRRGKRGSC